MNPGMLLGGCQHTEKADSMTNGQGSWGWISTTSGDLDLRSTELELKETNA